MVFDLSAYLARVALGEAPAPDAAGLARLQQAHRLAIPFECLDIALGRPIRIDGESVFAKLVTARRGGYCFEQNRLFGDALATLGFTARPLLARVMLDATGVGPKTHTLSLVTIDGQDWIADAGFGGSYVPPLPLVDGEETTTADGTRHRLVADPTRGWILLRDGDPATTDGRGAGPGWQPQYSFTLDAVVPADLAMGNHWTSTHPESRFVAHRIVSLVLPQGFVSLTDRRYSRRNGDQRSEGEIDDPRVYRLRLGLLFGIQLTAEEVMMLGLFG